jgi:hypothetical protein
MKPRHRWMDLGEMMDWIGLAQDSDKWRALVKAVTNLWIP